MVGLLRRALEAALAHKGRKTRRVSLTEDESLVLLALEVGGRQDTRDPVLRTADLARQGEKSSVQTSEGRQRVLMAKRSASALRGSTGYRLTISSSNTEGNTKPSKVTMRCASLSDDTDCEAAQSLSARSKFSRCPATKAIACRVATAVSDPNETSVLTTSCSAGRRSW